MFAFPKLKYRAAAEYPGYEHARVADPIEEEALGEDWHDTPAEAREAAEATPAPAAEKPKRKR